MLFRGRRGRALLLQVAASSLKEEKGISFYAAKQARAAEGVGLFGRGGLGMWQQEAVRPAVQPRGPGCGSGRSGSGARGAARGDPSDGPRAARR